MEDPTLAWMISRMEPPQFPVPLGIFRSIQKPSYAELILGQQESARARRGTGDLRKLYHDADTWEVGETAAVLAGSNGSTKGR
jgi:2-oxoglutarate/2-oxoacid ferredoxin oxidoreductase subunit beta